MSRCGTYSRKGISLAVRLYACDPYRRSQRGRFPTARGDPDWVANAFAGTAAKADDAGTVWSNPAGMAFVTLPNRTVELDTALNVIIPSLHFSGQNFVGSTPVSAVMAATPDRRR